MIKIIDEKEDKNRLKIRNYLKKINFTFNYRIKDYERTH